MPLEQSIRSFWDGAADRDPYWYVSSYGRYGRDRNVDEFWVSGQTIWADIKRVIGYEPKLTDAVVEIGCGVGRLTRAIAPEVARVVALDISENMLAIARKAHLPNVDFRTAEGFTLAGIPDRSIDLALGYCVFQHLPSNGALRAYLAEMHRVVKPGAIIAFTLVPRDWTTWLLPVLRVKAYLRERFSSGAPEGVYRKEWVGIRPSISTVAALTPVPMNRLALGGHRVLYFGRR